MRPVRGPSRRTGPGHALNYVAMPVHAKGIHSCSELPNHLHVSSTTP
jgi:hypothetical protein